jgi:RNA polymerase-binding transcription factor DksA
MDANRARSLLTAERDRLDRALGGVRHGGDVGRTEQEATGDLAAYDQHPAEEATETQSAEVDGAIESHLREQLDEVEAALARVEDGSFGACEICGRPIGDERLEARPAARFCLEHERQAESQAAAVGPPWET